MGRYFCYYCLCFFVRQNSSSQLGLGVMWYNTTVLRQRNFIGSATL